MIDLPDVEIEHEFVVCEGIEDELIIGLDFQRLNKVETRWEANGEMTIVIAQSKVKQLSFVPMASLRAVDAVCIPARTAVTIRTTIANHGALHEDFYDVGPSQEMLTKYPGVAVPTVTHRVSAPYPIHVPHQLINLTNESCYIPRGTIVGNLNQLKHIETVAKLHRVETLPKMPENSSFIPNADVSPHQKFPLADAPLTKEIKKKLENLLERYSEAFSQGPTDIGHSNLVTMDIDTGDSPPISQRPYTISLKHLDWVRAELENLERAGIIEQCISPWGSPIVIVPKKSAPGEPIQRRMCVDYRALNALLPKTLKVGSNAKGVLSHVPLPKIDELYARLRGAKFFSILDVRMGYHHMSLTEEASLKSCMTTPFGKFRWLFAPFGLAQAPAYFQLLINRALEGTGAFAMAYLDDVIIFSPDAETHLQHIEIVLGKMRDAGIKLKQSKCEFFKKEVQYLGHLISDEGIRPLPDKLESIRNIPPPKNVKDIQCLLGLTNYYRKFVPRYSDLVRPIVRLVRKDVPFEWTDTCQVALDMLKDALSTAPILKYPNPEKPCILYTDASKYAWAGVLCQQYEYPDAEKETERKVSHPVFYVSGLFKGSQCNWATLTKEAYAIYQSLKKLSFMVEGAEVTVRTDHLPLRSFLKKTTLNTKVNNWAVELEMFKVDIEYVKGARNVLADALSRLIDHQISEKNPPEPPGYEYGYALFGTEDSTVRAVKHDPDTYTPPFSITNKHLRALQKNDPHIQQLGNSKGGRATTADHEDQDGVWYRTVQAKGVSHEALWLPQELKKKVLYHAHNLLGHPGVARLYSYLKRRYYWKGMYQDIVEHVRQCVPCQSFNTRFQNPPQLIVPPAKAPMAFLSMDLIGRFDPPTSRGNVYALTAIDMLTGYAFCVPIPDKRAGTVVNAYIHHIHPFGGSLKFLTDNGTEFQNQLFRDVARELGVQHLRTTAPYHPQSNGRIEGFHKYLKAATTKYICPQVEWDQAIGLAVQAYNFLPNEHTRESPFFGMFARDPILPLDKLLAPRVRSYITDDDGTAAALSSIRKMLSLLAYNLKWAREKEKPIPDPRTETRQPLAVGDLVIIKNHTKASWGERYLAGWRVTDIRRNIITVQDADGRERQVHRGDCTKTSAVQRTVDAIPQENEYAKYGRAVGLECHPQYLQDLKWKWGPVGFTGSVPFIVSDPPASVTNP